MKRLDLDTDVIVELYEVERLSAPAIARRFECSDAAIYSRLESAGVQRSSRARIPIGEASELYQEGWSLVRLGERYGYTPQAVAASLRRQGVPLRSHLDALQPLGRSPAPTRVESRAYLLGFAWGDLAVERVNENSKTVAVRSSTTHQEQLDLIRDSFGRYGAVSEFVQGNATAIRVSLDNSFMFLFAKYQTVVPEWVTTDVVAGAAFVAGYIDAEGSFGVYEGRGRFKIDSYDREVLEFVHEWCQHSGIRSVLKCVAMAGSSRPEQPPLNGDLWRVNVNDRFSLLRLIATLDPFLRHARRRVAADLVRVNVTNRLRDRVRDCPQS